jgi:hypothetical protein
MTNEQARQYLLNEGFDPDQLAAEGVAFVNNLMDGIKNETTHELKTWPEYFKDVWNNTKTFEIRKNDRHYRAGDMLRLREWSSVGGYTGREIERRISYVFLGGTMGIEQGYCVLGLCKLFKTKS